VSPGYHRVKFKYRGDGEVYDTVVYVDPTLVVHPMQGIPIGTGTVDDFVGATENLQSVALDVPEFPVVRTDASQFSTAPAGDGSPPGETISESSPPITAASTSFLPPQ
jgi:hypothetical protein